MVLPKLIVTDIDGVWTDGGMYYSEKGEELKKFNTYDSAGVLFCKKMGIPVCIMTGEYSLAVKKRSEKLNVDYLFLGEKNKLSKLSELCEKLSITFKEVAYLGDDLNDIEAIKVSGLTACPKSAPFYVKNKVDWVLKKNGGEGVFREFIEGLIEKNGIDIERFIGSKITLLNQ